MTKPTIAKLQAAIAELTERCNRRGEDLQISKAAHNAAESALKDSREHFSDLKRRLHDAETELARLNGYLARVREDDTVREELLTVGEPGGEQRLVPKRKPEYLGNPEYRFPNMGDGSIYGYERQKKPKHWIEY